LGAIVYQQPSNGSGTLNINGNAFDYVGDQAMLAGTEREITQIDIGTRYFGTRPAALQVTLELYGDMSPVDHLPDDVDAVTAGNQYQIIGSSTITLNYVTGPDQIATFPFANVLVPDNIVFVVKQDTFDNNFALFLGGQSTIGDSMEFSGPSQRIVFSQQGNDNFGRGNTGGAEVQATIHAVPEPAALGLIGLAGLGMLRRRSRRQA
jgi:hypothetical protein